ncbi:hypothetical protein KSB_17040 [Ktedonobacter robiniae]|uniref:Uncharacterized protein n=1 Tax=Ktedonobacter robiniae TaxID=2778365 RepID=A0ABQ3UKK6_9CHLR|nr:hypothetical protein KSB_17040 [Ktedonobacter robiniae]
MGLERNITLHISNFKSVTQIIMNYLTAHDLNLVYTVPCLPNTEGEVVEGEVVVVVRCGRYTYEKDTRIPRRSLHYPGYIVGLWW